MKNSFADIDAIRKLHHAGQLTEARNGYLSLLKINSQNIDALHGLSIIAAQQEDFENAQKYLETAIALSPNNPSLQLHLANILKSQGLYKEAGEILTSLIGDHPGLVAAYNNLGTIYFAQQQWQEAEQCYREAIAKQNDYFDAYYNLGLVLTRQNKIDEAIETYSTIIRFTPYHIAARFQLGCLFLQKNMADEALCCFSTLAESNPGHFETISNLATCYLQLGKLDQAKKYYLKALEISNDDTQILFNLGVIEMQNGNIDNAIRYYQRALAIDVDLFDVQNNLAVAFLARQHIGFALKHFKEALRLQPNNKAIQYTVQMLGQDQRLQAAPVEYIKNLFDAYADHYEPHLMQALDYKVPDLIYRAVKQVRPLPNQQWDILDLGCGTGLCAVPFQAAAKSLVGVDISEKMLAVAAQKNIYQQLHPGDFMAFLADKKAAYDLILAGDVLVYIGELSALFAAITIALKPQGLFVFNAEIGTQEDFQMTQSGRFTHKKAYIDKLIADKHLKILSYQPVITRQQNNTPVHGHLYVVERQ